MLGKYSNMDPNAQLSLPSYFETTSLYVAYTGLEISLYLGLDLKSRFSCLSLAGIIGLCLHA